MSLIRRFSLFTSYLSSDSKSETLYFSLPLQSERSPEEEEEEERTLVNDLKEARWEEAGH